MHLGRDGCGGLHRATSVLHGVMGALHGVTDALHGADIHVRRGALGTSPPGPPGEDRALAGLPQGDIHAFPCPQKAFNLGRPKQELALSEGHEAEMVPSPPNSCGVA